MFKPVSCRTTCQPPGWPSQHRGIITSAYAFGDYGPRYRITLATRPNGYDLSTIIYGFGRGSRQNLDLSDFKRLPVFGATPAAEQAAIVRFLDHADRRIRRYIRAKQKLIKLLEEQKQAIIHRAVTRGLDPNVRLKPSGVEWLGDVPEHWEVTAARRCGSSSDRADVRQDITTVVTTESRPILRVANVQVGRVDSRRVKRIDVHAGGKRCQRFELATSS